MDKGRGNCAMMITPHRVNWADQPERPKHTKPNLGQFFFPMTICYSLNFFFFFTPPPKKKETDLESYFGQMDKVAFSQFRLD